MNIFHEYFPQTFTNASRVELLAGEKNTTCDLEIIDDEMYEMSEYLLVRLAEPTGCEAITGDLDVTLVTIEDPEDGKGIESSSNFDFIDAFFNLKTNFLSCRDGVQSRKT